MLRGLLLAASSVTQTFAAILLAGVEEEEEEEGKTINDSLVTAAVSRELNEVIYER